MIDPFGKVTVLDGLGTTVRTASLYGNPWTFTGRRLDQETGLMYYRNRMYSVELGRFVSRDPLEYVDGASMYGAYFVPEGTDPLGLMDYCECIEKHRPGTTPPGGCCDIQGFREKYSLDCLVADLNPLGGPGGAVVGPGGGPGGKAGGAKRKGPPKPWKHPFKWIGWWADHYNDKTPFPGGAAGALKAANQANVAVNTINLAGGVVIVGIHAMGSQIEALGALSAASGYNPIQGLERVGSALKPDPYHAFPNVVDNFASGATKTQLERGATLYQLEGSLNGTAGRFEWIVQDGNVTHRLFVPGGTMSGVPIKP